MNIPFRFALSTLSLTPYGLLFDYTGATGTGNETLMAIAAVPALPDGLGLTAAARLRACSVFPPSAQFYITGFSITAWYDDSANPVKVMLGLQDTVNDTFIPLYETVATAVPGGGIQKTFNTGETGFFVPQSATRLPALKVVLLDGAATDVTVCGDISLYPVPSN